ncbi:hypothetical protein AWJ20_4799 [Sugiyamaella lignohabitans]|uniref:Myb-like domain-containing protein n=1 Tax=Sugiyamaella lignohabitans TaxID=796027 RepID=A0A167EAV3_9ASCO|nr:uncharacterized protein AWJ20_4799 [Sugiyamaella lignohabitans]ANB13850.1 hypothetical protein AWJ20_4799 [Sugiyamaella lignohabitans]
MNIAEILNDDGEERIHNNASSRSTSPRSGSPVKRPRNSSDIEGGSDPKRLADGSTSTLKSDSTPLQQSPSAAGPSESGNSNLNTRNSTGGLPRDIEPEPTAASSTIASGSSSSLASIPGPSIGSSVVKSEPTTEGAPVATVSGGESEGTPAADKKGKSKRSKAKNSTWAIEDDRKLVDLVMSTLPTQDFAEYARVLNKRDAQTIRYRWKVILRRAKGEGL